MAEKILILGGTAEAAELAANLAAQGKDVTTSLAGRTREPLPLVGNVRTGGFGGARGLAQYLRENAFDRMIDATHPFARQISVNAAEASEIAGIPLEAISRPAWQREPGDTWIEVTSLEQARDALPAGARAFLALGSQHVAVFANRGDVHFVVRMVDAPSLPLPLADYQLITGMPSSDPATETQLFRQHRITHLVCRNSGGTRGHAKITAARNLRLPIVMLQR
jgi:precorrin-6A/cobalt-precorrin-6A reductase